MDFNLSKKYQDKLIQEVEECLNFFKEEDKIPNDNLIYIIKYFNFANEEEEIKEAQERLLIPSEDSFYAENAKDYLLARLEQRDPIDYYSRLFLSYADPNTKKINVKFLSIIMKKVPAYKDKKSDYIKKLIQSADSDNDGEVTVEDFIAAVKSVILH